MTSAKWILDGVMQGTVDQPMPMDSFGEVELPLVEPYGAMQTVKLKARSQYVDAWNLYVFGGTCMNLRLVLLLNIRSYQGKKQEQQKGKSMGLILGECV